MTNCGVGSRVRTLVMVCLLASCAFYATAAPARAAVWCGGTATAADRIPDAAGGNQVHVIYAVPSDAPDRFGERAPQIADDLQLVDSWWRLQDPTRTPRFD